MPIVRSHFKYLVIISRKKMALKNWSIRTLLPNIFGVPFPAFAFVCRPSSCILIGCPCVCLGFKPICIDIRRLATFISQRAQKCNLATFLMQWPFSSEEECWWWYQSEYFGNFEHDIPTRAVGLDFEWRTLACWHLTHSLVVKYC